MRKTDRERGRLKQLTRRDFIHGTSLAALGLMLPLSHQAQAQNEADVIVYGSTPGPADFERALAGGSNRTIQHGQ